MLKVFLFICIVLFIFSPLFRLIVKKLPQIYFYGLRDIILYFKDKKWEKVSVGYGITCFIGMFGHGKTLSMVKACQSIYDTYGDKVRFISNVKLNHIPYIPLTNFNQIVKLQNEVDSPYEATILCIDEIEYLLSHRNFANFPLTMLGSICQQRKLASPLKIYCTCQRWFTVDKIWRSLTTDIYDCNKFWRFQHMVKYDAWDYENAMNFNMIRPISNTWWFVTDRIYNAYDTTELITDETSNDFLSNEETIVRVGLDNMSNPNAIRKPRKQRKEKRRRG